MVDSVHVDPDAVATYEAVAAQVADELTIAAAQLAAGTDPARIGAGLGLLGAEFATEFATAVADEQTALSTASALVAAYGRAVSGYAAATGTVDDSVAAAITKAGEQA
ncbi:hypothetical protein [Nocardia donostiensis]|uniref:ESX-1 secretion-associated protein n=1 Tax=Nocardia donostiensis TaxID=1538463 RepID=A0A1W0B1P2_9NOCA|nr:hypothetical protein [Nocardia donostiensis]ONM48549.1 hypothetical protein B0T46_12610 [Nocardia donostiensis]OQS16377.1 hypothetical protein B0T36_04595 [Nocardia donostiensis]OQS19364.1 hypothetical protein B0T44_15150 [Nocardia donostiensis]